MDNIRHERSFLIITSYIIGLVTAFIYFGIGEKTDQIIYENIPIETAKNNPLEKITNPDTLNHPFLANMLDNDKFMFLCDKPEENSDYCTPYLFLLEENTSYPVMLDNKPITISHDVLPLVKLTDEGLYIPTTFIPDRNTPWLLAYEDTPIDLPL